ncbi:MAG TPA: alpha/beta fold hydrolase [Candidatus Saccharimonadales bacterium]|nr:alpha/beta fold hydrolase [Candidatus Saccharimonadales bacterium]
MESKNHKNQSRENKLSVRSLWLDPSVIYNKKNTMQNISQMLKDSKHSNGIVADGVSRILIVANYDSRLKFSVTGPSNIDYGSLISINDTNDPKSNSIVADPITLKYQSNGSVVAAIYKGPKYIDMKKNTKHLAVTISVSDIKKEYIRENIMIKVYRVPIILVHGVWSNPHSSWEITGFKQFLQRHGFCVSMVNYEKYNDKTFDPNDEPKIGNQAIAELKSSIHEVLEEHNKKYISASQVDIIAHSMGGLIARGLCQQNGYKAKENYMKGQIRRLITIGTPHFGAGLSGRLFRQKDNWYSYKQQDNKDPFTALWNSNYAKDSDYKTLQLKDIYSFTPIDKGAIESLAPDSAAYSNLLPTNVKSYAIAGTWKPEATVSQKVLEEYYRNILGIPFFSLDKEGFNGDNDLQVSVSSQLGGLDGKCRRSVDKNPPKYGAIYENTLHASWFKKDDNDNVIAELQSCLIREDIVDLLGSSDDNFVDIIGDVSDTLGLANKSINEKTDSKPDSNIR